LRKGADEDFLKSMANTSPYMDGVLTASMKSQPVYS
jgi:hypothetical protein